MTILRPDARCPSGTHYRHCKCAREQLSCIGSPTPDADGACPSVPMWRVTVERGYATTVLDVCHVHAWRALSWSAAPSVHAVTVVELQR